MRKIHQFILYVALLGVASSCVTQKQITYLQDAEPSMADSINRHFQAQPEPTFMVGDALTIMVNALDKEAVIPYNLTTVVAASPGTNTVQTAATLQYYVVDDAGDIEMPVLGKLHVAGLKRSELERLVREKLEQQVQDPIVMANLVYAKVTVLGEVAVPSQIPMARGRMTILEALAAAGDMTPYGRRDNVLVTREVDGKLEIARVNLRNSDLYTSPYYYLQQNDVVYVSPNKVRAITSTNAGLWLSMVSTVASAATVIVTVVNVSRNAGGTSSSTGK